jgi:anti-anti-sigma factor
MVLDVMSREAGTVMSPVLRVMQPEGILDGIQAQLLRREIEQWVDEDIDVILLDLSDTSFLDSSGLGALVAALKKVRAAERRLCLCSPNEQLQMVFELSGTDQAFEIFPTRSEFERTMRSAF